jgi:glutathione peroxidase
MFSKIDVNGDNTHPLYKYLKSKVGGGLFGSFIKWNFTKFLIDRNGQPIQRYAPTVSPKNIENDIIGLLKSNSKI